MRNRLLLVFVGVMALVLAVHDIPLAAHLNNIEHDSLVTSLERDAFILAGRAEEALEGGTAGVEPALRDAVGDYSLKESVRVVVIDSNAVAVIVSDADSEPGEDFSNRPEVVTALSGQPDTGVRHSDTLDTDLFFVAVPVYSGDEVVGVVRLSAPDSEVEGRTDGRVRGLFLVALISLLIAAGAAFALASTVTRPIARLRSATHDLAAGNLGARADIADGPPEVRDLAVSFNTMASRLQSLVDRQRAFAGTASHQLRTPLTALRLRLDQAQQRLAGDLEASDRVEDAITEADRLQRMIEGLLALTRAEDAAVGPEVVDLAAIIRDRVEHWTPLADERHVSVTGLVPSALLVLAVFGAAEQIVDNLIDNALEVSPNGSGLAVTVEQDGDDVVLHVIDEGPGLNSVDRAKAFDRFWRGTDSTPGGSGLGLAIVRQLAEAGGGSVELRAAPSGGIDAAVRFHRPGRATTP